ncbi:MAG TPA: glycosyltransferase [Chitinophagaceae bacterium]|nr:glycosyltransferase [Chitinophagaceae bacterium]
MSQSAGRKPRVLVAPLDWGLGHTTRCIPVIRELLNQNTDVWLAGDTVQQQVLSAEFPQLPFLHLPGYQVRYGRSRLGLLASLLRQWPRLKKMIRQEHEWLHKKTDECHFDAVISDNRFGLWHRKITSIFLTHQLTIINPLFGKSSHFLQKINYRLLKNFDTCWIPDWPGEANLAGILSHPSLLPPVKLQYTGPLSRLQQPGATAMSADHLFISLSGPEPQRSLLEEKILQEVTNYAGTIVMVRGLPLSKNMIPSTGRFVFYNHLPAAAYQEEMSKAAWVICRSGYSTVMDLAALNKRAVLIPTPGQPEQEYLGKYLVEKGYALCMTQKRFNLLTAMETAKQFSYQAFPGSREPLLSRAVAELLQSISR